MAVPQDVVAIFHASFHPTQGNVLDWHIKASDDIQLDHLEFSALPSGLHLVEEDVVYFTRGQHHGVGVCVFRRRKTAEHGHRGFRLSSLGVLLARSTRPRPWRHVPALKRLLHSIYASLEHRGTLDPTEDDWAPARAFFDERRVRSSDLGGAGDWRGWSDDLDGPDSGSDVHGLNPTLHLPHLLRILGPSALTLYKHVLGRRRVLVFTLPPVEAACHLCQVAADLCFEDQVDPSGDANGNGAESENSNVLGDGWKVGSGRVKGRAREGVKVLGMINLNDMDKLREESATGRGWIACTTDAIFLERPQYYDLLIDLTTSTPSKASRPTLHVSRPLPPSITGRGPTHELNAVRFTWSDIKLWNELDRILGLDGSHGHDHPPPTSEANSRKGKGAWGDVWRLYEDVCVICAGLWIGSWRANSRASYSSVGGAWGSARAEGDQDLSIAGQNQVRARGAGIEGRPAPSPQRKKKMRSASGSGSWTRSEAASASSKTRLKGKLVPDLEEDDEEDEIQEQQPNEHDNDDSDAGSDAGIDQPDSSTSTDRAKADAARRERQLLTTLSLLQTFHAHTSCLLTSLSSLLPAPSAVEGGRTKALGPREMLALGMGPLSGLDARFVEWLAEEYAGSTRVVVRRGWRDVVGLVFGFG